MEKGDHIQTSTSTFVFVCAYVCLDDQCTLINIYIYIYLLGNLGKVEAGGNNFKDAPWHELNMGDYHFHCGTWHKESYRDRLTHIGHVY